MNVPGRLVKRWYAARNAASAILQRFDSESISAWNRFTTGTTASIVSYGNQTHARRDNTRVHGKLKTYSADWLSLICIESVRDVNRRRLLTLTTITYDMSLGSCPYIYLISIASEIKIAAPSFDIWLRASVVINNFAEMFCSFRIIVAYRWHYAPGNVVSCHIILCLMWYDPLIKIKYIVAF